jgi:AraC-like DNA-binding protein
VLLARAGINPTFMEQAACRVHTDQVARLFRLVQQELNDEFMGFTAQPSRYGIFQMFCELSGQCKTLGDLLEKMVLFYNLTTDSVKIQLHTNDSNITELQFHLTQPELDPEHFLAEWLLVTWHRFSSWYIAETIRLKGTCFSHEMPAHIKELRVMFPGSLSFKQAQTSISFSHKYLTKSLMRTTRELNTFLASHPAEIMTIPGEKVSLESAIEREIMQSSSKKLFFPKIEHLAKLLNLKPLTLYRRLKDEGTSYQKIKDNIRREMAIGKLVTGNLSVEEVSEIVGFMEPRSFTRAFKHWTGLTPRNYCKYQSLK